MLILITNMNMNNCRPRLGRTRSRCPAPVRPCAAPGSQHRYVYGPGPGTVPGPGTKEGISTMDLGQHQVLNININIEY